MKTVKIFPTKLKGTVVAPSSKSMGHREIICAGLAAGTSIIDNISMSKDIEATMRCLKAINVAVDEIPSMIEGRKALQISGTGHPMAAADSVDCGESGSTLRFLLPVAAALGCGGRFMGEGRLPQRTIAALVEQLCSHGCTTNRPDGLPLTLTGQLTSGDFTLPGNVSSQFVTVLLMALPMLPGDSRLRLSSALQSSAYVDLTIHLMKKFGVFIQTVENGWNIPGGQTYQSPGVIAAEGDWSGAAFWLAAGALGGDILSTGLDPDSPQGDKAFLTLLRDMGSPCSVEKEGIRSAGRICRPITADISQVPDLAPMLALLCAAGGQELHMVGGARLRDK